MLSPKERRSYFESMVLQGIWLLLLLAAGKRPVRQLAIWRGAAIDYFDVHGNQNEGAKEYRRTETFPELHP